jgi:hypothetical protein
MAGLGLNLTNSVANVRRKLLQMIDALAESGMRHAHREINRGREAEAKSMTVRRKRTTRDGSVH